MRGDRVQIPAYFDPWMRGKRFGVVIAVSPTRVRVHLDNSNIKVWIDTDILDNFGQWL